MKKSLFILIAAMLAFCACQRIPTEQAEGSKTYDISQLRFDFTIESGSATKGVRDSWLDGDVVFVFFENVDDAYVTVTYHSSTSRWDADPTAVGSSSSIAGLPVSGYLTAVYLPYGNNPTPAWDSNANAWVFSDTEPIDYYYMKSEKAAYFITDPGDVLPTLGAYLYMDTADRFMQFFIPDDSASGTIRFACNELVPAGIAGVSSDGTVTETTGTQGSWVTARADTIDDEKGYYVSGKLSPRPGLQYYFAMDKGSGTDRYKHYFKERSNTLAGRGAYQLPAESNWLTASSSTYVRMNGFDWCTVNLGAATPWALGTAKTAAELSSISVEKAEVPSDDKWSSLLDRTKVTWIQLSILGVDGFLVMDRLTPNNYFFLPAYNYWSTSKTETTQHYMKTDNEGTHEIASTNPPETAYVRLISSLYGGGFNPPENGGDI